MGFFQNRKMIQDQISLNVGDTKLCSTICDKDDDGPKICLPKCVDQCPDICKLLLEKSPPPPISYHDHSHKASTFLTLTIALLAASFLLVCAYALYSKYYARARTRHNDHNPINNNSNPRDVDVDDEDQFNQAGFDRDEERGGGATVEHHVWYIRTVGLDPSAIGSITLIKYRKDEGFVEGTDCSVCLSEFQEDEALRLLPKCTHAFHVACIDTWLRSHTNCPLCRAPVLSPPEPGRDQAVVVPARDDNSGGGGESARIELGEGDRVVDDHERPNNEDAVRRVVEPSRRSVSLDCLDAKELEVINKLRNNNFGGKRVVEKKLQRMRSGHVSSSSSSLSSSSMKRSSSCNGKFVMCRPVRVTDSILPLRSI